MSRYSASASVTKHYVSEYRFFVTAEADNHDDARQALKCAALKEVERHRQVAVYDRTEVNIGSIELEQDNPTRSTDATDAPDAPYRCPNTPDMFLGKARQ